MRTESVLARTICASHLPRANRFGVSVSESPKAIRADNLVKRFDDVTAVDGVDLSINRSEVFGLLGPNGAGKTTTIECLVGLRRPTSGSVRVLGLDPVVERDAITRRVAVQPQSAALFDTLTVRETVQLFASFHPSPRLVDEVIAEIGLEEKTRARAKSLSGGQTRRLLLGIALVGNPEVLVLDEPSAGLDPLARHSLWQVIFALRDRGTTVMLSTHHMDEATTVCDRVAIMVGGRIAAMDSPSELVRKSAMTSEVQFSVDAAIGSELLQDALGTSAFAWRPSAGFARVSLRTAEPDAIIRRITFHRTLKPRDLRVIEGTLEDIFLGLAEDGVRR